MSIPKYPFSLKEAQQAPDGYVVMTGEFGGICYLVCPAGSVKCDERTLLALVHELDDIVAGDPEGTGVNYVRFSIGEKVSGLAWREEEGIAGYGLWLPSWLIQSPLAEKVRRILNGERAGLESSLSDRTRVKTLYRQMKRLEK